MKIIHERKKCIGCGACIAVCAKFFEMGEDGKSTLKNAIEKENGIFELEIEEADCAEEAAEVCPVQIIKVMHK
jgi:ferredoxin